MNESFGRYSVIRQLGKGAMGVVYLASDPMLNRQVAVKTVDLGADMEADEREFMRTRLLRDARAAAILKHPNIVAIYDVFEDAGRAYVVMEFVEGDNLAAVLKKNPLPESALVLKILRQMADGLDYTHAQGVIHRDIKPANVMINANGMAKIMDFGIARITDTRTCTPTGMVMGTVEYMAPEQILGAAVDGRADQFALAVVAYQMMTASSLFGPHTLATLTYKLVNEAPALPSTRNATLPRAVDAVLTKALSKTPADRFSSCGEFVNALSRAYSDAPTAPLAPPTAPVTVATQPTQGVTASSMQATVAYPPPKSSKAPLIAAAAAVVILGGALAAVVLKPWNHAATPTEATAAAAKTAVPEVTHPATPEPVTAVSNKPDTKTKPEVKPPTPVETKVPAGKAGSAPGVPTPVAQPEPEPEMIVTPAETKAGKTTPYTQAMRRGEQQVKDNDYPAALQSFSQALTLRPLSGQAHYSRGLAYQHLEQYDAAMRDYNDALRAEPKSALAHIGLGGCLVRLHRDDDAMQEFQQAIFLKPEAVVALTGRGNIYLRRKNYKLALADFDKALSVNPRYAPALQSRAHAKEATGDLPGAATDRRTADAIIHKQ
jgi:serine/threonine protein kinase/Tfp pilus assembly protein PilF